MALIDIDGLNVLSVFSHNLKESVKFYTEILGFKKTRDMDPGVLLHLEQADIVLYLEGDKQRRESAMDMFNHVSFCLNAKNGVKDAKEKLIKKDIEVFVEYGDFDGDFAGIQFLDPSGNVIEIAGQP